MKVSYRVFLVCYALIFSAFAHLIISPWPGRELPPATQIVAMLGLVFVSVFFLRLRRLVLRGLAKGGSF